MKKPKPTYKPMERHANCQVEVRLSNTQHYAAYYCLDCKKHVAWLTKVQTKLAEQQGLIND